MIIGCGILGYLQCVDLRTKHRLLCRILMCFMCGDDINLSYLLSPLLSHQCCYVTSDKFPTVTLETYLGDSKRKVEVVVTSYHGASVIQDSLYHGYILVYSAKRKASLRTMG